MMARRVLNATRTGPLEDDPEAEPVLIETDGISVTFTLDDGEEFTFDRVELQDELDAVVAEAVPGRLAA